MTVLHFAGPMMTLERAVAVTADAVEQATTQTMGPNTMRYQYASEVSWGLIIGQLRGRLPFPIPYELMAVAVTVAVRWYNVLADGTTLQVQGSDVLGTKETTFTGFTLSELVCLWRYRIRTA